ncbi:NADH-dependent flavin oxidoreductase [uncultured Deinococcus sp.]|uniref:NADH-dependent flavin oxidoreductase n=1 Tax=uncultured Deinococcus sp. TaxID=158789 RepID=UPI00258BB679|nr:NADH-dependent flavin oxidoreductase [uncultured Deinococcus sp.]
MNPKFQTLFQPITLRSGVQLDNRVVLAPMTNFSSDAQGNVTDDELAYYARRSNGVGLVLTACTNVTRNGQGFPGEFAGYDDRFVPSLTRLARTVQGEGAKVMLQIFHAGRMAPAALVDGDVVSASAVAPVRDGAEQAPAPAPRELSGEEVEEIVRAFGETTRRAIESGYDGVEIHGANGYLIQQFFSPHSNRRTDRWGGSIEARMAFPLAVVDEVQRVVAEYARTPFAVGYRFSPEEPETPGITLDDSLALVDALADKGLDYLHVSLMEYASLPRRASDTAQSRLEQIVAKVAGRTPVMGVGSVHTPEQATQVLDMGAEFVALGRELLMDPDWVAKVREGREAELETVLDVEGQDRLVIATPLWNALVNTPGWLPLSKKPEAVTA